MLLKQKGNDIFVRHELNNYVTVNSQKYGLKVLNPTAAFIYDRCDGSNNLYNIVDMLQSEYPDVSKERIESDVKEILYYLRDLELIDFEKDTPDAEPFEFKTAADEDFRKIKKFIIRNLLKKHPDINTFASIKDPKYYTEYMLRSRQFSLNELNYICLNQGEITDLIAIKNIDNLTGTVEISVFMCNISSESFSNFYSFVINDLKKYRVRKIDFTIIQDSTTFNQFEDIGFTLEATLKAEVNSKDLYFYTKFIA